MPRQMPILKHNGEKLTPGKAFWALPQDIVIYAFKNLTYGETQLLIYLMGNKPANQEEEYKGWQLININDCMGIGERSVRDARRVLAEMGFIKLTPGPVDSTYVTIEVDFDWIREVIENDWDKNTTKQNYKNRSGSTVP